MSLKIDYIIPYLLYGLEFKCTDLESDEYDILPIQSINIINEYIEIGSSEYDFDDLDSGSIKPVLRPLSDLTKMINCGEGLFIPIKEIFHDYREGLELSHRLNSDGILEDLWLDYPDSIGEYVQESSFTYSSWDLLFKYHFDVFGLIAKGLASDINKIRKF